MRSLFREHVKTTQRRSAQNNTKMHFFRKTQRYRSFFQHPPLNQFYALRADARLNDSLQKAVLLKEEIINRQPLININLQSTLADKLRYLWIFNSNAFEGNQLTFSDTIYFLQEHLTVAGKPLKDFLAAENHLHAIEYLYEVNHKKIPINSELLRTLNVLLLKNMNFKAQQEKSDCLVKKTTCPGEYRTVKSSSVAFQIYYLFEWMKENQNKQDPIITAAIAHYNLMRINPFQEGNFRTAHLFMNLILMSHQFLPAIIDVKNKTTYLDCWQKADHGDLLPFVQHIADLLNDTQAMILNEMAHVEKMFTPASSSHTPPSLGF